MKEYYVTLEVRLFVRASDEVIAKNHAISQTCSTLQSVSNDIRVGDAVVIACTEEE